MKLSQELKDFIISFCKEMKIKNIDAENISLDTSLDLDLNIFDLDMDVFIADFSKKFDIDISGFEWGKKYDYPSGKGMGILYMTLRSFNYKKDWVKRMCRKLYNPKIYVRDLQNAIEIKAFI
ncbi:DUF1493 family protein [Niabella aquatica]